MFALEIASSEWPTGAAIQIARTIQIAAAPEAVFSLLADHERWPTWFKGMRRARVDAGGTGVGTLRTVWVGLSRVQEQFSVWEEPEHPRFAIVASNLPGLRAMVEDWRLRANGGGTELTITLGVEGAGPLAMVPGLVRFVVARSTRGAAGIAGAFAAPRGAG